MLRSIICLLLFGSPFLGQATDPVASTSGEEGVPSGHSPYLTLKIYFQTATQVDPKTFDDVKFEYASPPDNDPISLSTAWTKWALATFGTGLDATTWTNKVNAQQLTEIPLSGPTKVPSHIQSAGLAEIGVKWDLNCNVILQKETDIREVAWILDRGLELFFVDGKRGSPPGPETLNISCVIPVVDL